MIVSLGFVRVVLVSFLIIMRFSSVTFANGNSNYQFEFANRAISGSEAERAANFGVYHHTNKVGFVDIQKVLENSIFAQNIKKLSLELKKELQKDLEKKEIELRNVEKILADQRDKIPEVEFKKKNDEFKQRVSKNQRVAQEAKHSLDQEYAIQMQKILETISKIIKETAENEDLDIVFSSNGNVLFFKQSMDFTDTVIRKLNSVMTHPKITRSRYNK